MKILIVVLFLCLGVFVFFPTFFPGWIFMYLIGVGMGILLLGLGLFHRMKVIKNIVKRIFFKCSYIIVGISLILFFFPYAVSSIRDIGPYLFKEYETTKGIPTKISSMGKKWREQTIEINQMELINTLDIAWEDQDKKMEIKYLPRSKYVMSIKIIE
ncbi:hypothetical protein [Paenibacillus sp. QZ-Y1]|uniref:hypothetical protein n=1 Tax=Paenibacillus sp. QZ-Y1 TaxID=3414511 RepID=UPI003F7AAB2B